MKIATKTLPILGLVAAIACGPLLAQAPSQPQQSPQSQQKVAPAGAAAPVAASPTPPVPANAGAAASPEGQKVHVAQDGDTFSKIGRAHGLNRFDLEKWNPGLVERGIKVGDKVRLTPAEGVTAHPVRKIKKAPAKVSPEVGAGQTTQDAAKEAGREASKHTEAPRSPKESPSKPTIVQAPKQVVEVRQASAETVRILKETSTTRDVLYSPDAIPTINCEQKIAVTIYLPDKEKIATTVAGDTEEWLITPAVGKNVVLVKATLENRKTNLVVFTRSGNTYHMTLTSDPAKPFLQILRIHPPQTDGDDSGVMTPGGTLELGGPSLGAADPTAGNLGIPADRNGRMDPLQVQAAMDRVREEEQQKARDRERAFMQAMLAGRNDQFKISYDWNTPFRITHAFSASQVTYLRVEVPKGLQPLLYVIEDGKESVVPWTVSRVDPNVIMVDRLFEKATLVLGKKRARIENLGLRRELSRLKKESKNG